MGTVSVSGLSYGRPTRGQAEAFINMAGQAFGFDPAQWLSSLGDDGWNNVRTLTAADQSVVAGLVFHATGQWFGGRRVAMSVAAAVLVAPPFRGEGVGRHLMLEGLRETRAAGVPLSALSASTSAFYRGIGFEPAGERRFYRSPIAALPRDSEGARYVELPLEQRSQVAAVYERFARERSGVLDRSEHFWRSHLQPYDGSKRYVYRIDFPEGPEGYVSLQHGFPERTLLVEDAIATTPRSARALLCLLARHGAQSDWVLFPDGPRGPLSKLIPDHRGHPDPSSSEWLLRITDVPGALAGRGYPPIDAVLELEVLDDDLPDNAGRYVLRLSGGNVDVARGGEGRIRLNARALAAIYTGFSHPREMLAVGMLDGESSQLELMGAVFAGPRPFVLDSLS